MENCWKEKWTNKVTDKPYVADSFIHNLMFVPNFKILGQVVPEKSLTENFVREKEKWTYKGTDKPYVADS